jgi:hypothetical protein
MTVFHSQKNLPTAAQKSTEQTSKRNEKISRQQQQPGEKEREKKIIKTGCENKRRKTAKSFSSSITDLSECEREREKRVPNLLVLYVYFHNKCKLFSRSLTTCCLFVLHMCMYSLSLWLAG